MTASRASRGSTRKAQAHRKRDLPPLNQECIDEQPRNRLDTLRMARILRDERGNNGLQGARRPVLSKDLRKIGSLLERGAKYQSRCDIAGLFFRRLTEENSETPDERSPGGGNG